MPCLLLRFLPAAVIPAIAYVPAMLPRSAVAEGSNQINQIHMPHYSVAVVPGESPRLAIERDNEAVMEVPMVSGLASDTEQEKLSGVEYALKRSGDGTYELNATAKSSLWSERRSA